MSSVPNEHYLISPTLDPRYMSENTVPTTTPVLKNSHKVTPTRQWQIFKRHYDPTGRRQGTDFSRPKTIPKKVDVRNYRNPRPKKSEFRPSLLFFLSPSIDDIIRNLKCYGTLKRKKRSGNSHKNTNIIYITGPKSLKSPSLSLYM